MEYTDLVTVYTVANPVEAEIIKNALKAEGIPCTLEGANQAAEPGLMGIPIKVQTRAGDGDRARSFIAAHQRRKPGSSSRAAAQWSR